MILKSGKQAENVKSYQVSLFPISSKVIEILFLKRLMPLVLQLRFLPDHQFDFRQKHSTIEQVHRLVNKIHSFFSHLWTQTILLSCLLGHNSGFLSSVHKGLLYKIKIALSNNFYVFIRSYLCNRHFQVKQTLYQIFTKYRLVSLKVMCWVPLYISCISLICQLSMV